MPIHRAEEPPILARNEPTWRQNYLDRLEKHEQDPGGQTRKPHSPASFWFASFCFAFSLSYLGPCLSSFYLCVPALRALGVVAGTMARNTAGSLAITRFIQNHRQGSRQQRSQSRNALLAVLAAANTPAKGHFITLATVRRLRQTGVP